MSLTKPEDFPIGGGADERDGGNLFEPTKPPLKIYLKPLTQKIIEKYLWLEVAFVTMLFFTGLGELFSKRFSMVWYILLILVSVGVGLKFLSGGNFEHKEVTKKTDEPVEEKQS